MFCKNCGREIENDSRFCGYCGANTTNNIDTNPYTIPTNNQQQENVNEQFKPDNRFNIMAFLFLWIWAAVKGLWDLMLIDLILSLVIFIPVVGWLFLLIWRLFAARNANYYYRIKEQMKIPFYKAIQDTNIRRI